MGTIAEKVAGLLPESASIDCINNTVSERVAETLALYCFSEEAELTEAQKLMVSLDVCLALIPPAIDYYKSRATDSTVLDTTLNYRDRMKGLEMLLASLKKRLDEVKATLGYAASLPYQGLEKVVEDVNFYTAGF